MPRADSVVTQPAGAFASSPQANRSLRGRPGEDDLVWDDGYEEPSGQPDGPPPTREQANKIWYHSTGLVDESKKGTILDWDSRLTYSIRARVVGSDNNGYRAIQASTNVDPTTDTDNSHWERTVPPAVTVPVASESVAGVIQLGDADDQQTGTSETKGLSIKRIADMIRRLVPLSRLLPTGNGTVGQFLAHDKTFRDLPTATDATDSVRGIVELSDESQADTGTDTATAMTPALVRRVADARATANAVASNRLLPATAGTTSQWLRGDATYQLLPAATANAAGITEYADSTETADGVTNRAVTPSELPFRNKITYSRGSTPTAANKTDTVHLVER